MPSISMRQGVRMAVGIFVVFILAGALLPTAFDQIFNATTTSWSSNTVTIWELLPLMGVLALLLLFVGWATDRI